MSAAPCSRCGAPLTGAADGVCPLCAGRLALDSAELPVQADAPARGARLGGYELLEEIGRGAMGVVYRARQGTLKRIVALKVVQSGQFASEAERKRFLTEAELAATLDHPNIVPVYEVGTAEGRPFCAMKFVEGRSLAAMMGEGFCSRRQCEAHRPPPKLLPGVRGCCVTAASLIAKTARAVHHAHQRGIIHRDLKPGNILVDAAGEPHITDFGLARRLDDTSTLTLTGSPLGTPAYMSPEQARGEKSPTTASDIWSLGAILYELLAGRPPFVADNVPALLRKIAEEEPAPLRRARSEIPNPKSERGSKSETRNPRATAGDAVRTSGFGFSSDFGLRTSDFPLDPDLATLCLKCLEKDPARRYDSAAALADDLDRWQRNEPILARRTTGWERTVKWIARHPRRTAMLLALLLVFLAGVLGVFWQWRRAEQETARVRETAARETAALLRNEAAKDAFLEQARAFRASGQPGQRLKALEALAAAARIRPGLELRHEALAALALPDLHQTAAPIALTEATPNIGFDVDVHRGVTVGVGDELRLLDLAGGNSLTNFSVGGLHFGWLNFSPDGRWLSSRDLAEAVLLNLNSGQMSQRYPARFGMKHHPAVQFSPDSRQAAIADGNETIALVEIETGAVTRELSAGGIVDAFAFSPDERHLAVMAGRALQVRRLVDGELAARYVMPPGSWVSWQADGGRLFVCSPEGAVRVVETDSGLVRGLPTHTASYSHRAIAHPRGALLATASPAWNSGWTGSGLWDAASGRLWFTVPDAVYHFSRDGRRLACVRNNAALVVWNVIEADAVRSFPGPTNAVLDADVSPEGHWLATASDDGVRLWKLASGQETDFTPLPGVESVRFAPDGGALFAAGSSNAWRLPLLEKDRRFRRELGFGEAQPEQLADRASEPPQGLGVRRPSGAFEDPQRTKRRRAGALQDAAATVEASPADLAADIALGGRVRLTDRRSGSVLAELTPADGGRLARAFLSRNEARHVVAVGEDGFIHAWDLLKLRAELGKLGLDWSDTNAPPSEAAAPDDPSLSATTGKSGEPLFPSPPPTRPAPTPVPDGIAARDPAATPRQLDLTAHYNALLTENWMGGRADVDDSFASLPRGLQQLGGVLFDVRGVVQLTSSADDPPVKHFPRAIRDLAVDQTCARLHVLLAGRWTLASLKDEPAAHFILRYADGRSVTNSIRAGVELGDAWQWPGRTCDAPAAEIVWRGTNAASASFGASLRLFRWPCENPRPAMKVISLDIVSAMSPAAPFLIAITAE